MKFTPAVYSDGLRSQRKSPSIQDGLVPWMRFAGLEPRCFGVMVFLFVQFMLCFGLPLSGLLLRPQGPFGHLRFGPRQFALGLIQRAFPNASHWRDTASTNRDH